MFKGPHPFSKRLRALWFSSVYSFVFLCAYYMPETSYQDGRLLLGAPRGTKWLPRQTCWQPLKGFTEWAGVCLKAASRELGLGTAANWIIHCACAVAPSLPLRAPSSV